MEFDFEKFVVDIEKRAVKENSQNVRSLNDIDLEKARRLRDQRYFEHWQNRIVWEKKRNG